MAQSLGSEPKTLNFKEPKPMFVNRQLRIPCWVLVQRTNEVPHNDPPEPKAI